MCVCVCACVRACVRAHTQAILVLGIFHLKVSFPYICAIIIIIIIFFDMWFEQRGCWRDTQVLLLNPSFVCTLYTFFILLNKGSRYTDRDYAQFSLEVVGFRHICNALQNLTPSGELLLCRVDWRLSLLSFTTCGKTWISFVERQPKPLFCNFRQSWTILQTLSTICTLRWRRHL